MTLIQEITLITLTSLATSFMNGSSTAFILYFLINLFSTTITSWMMLKRDLYLAKCEVEESYKKWGDALYDIVHISL